MFVGSTSSWNLRKLYYVPVCQNSIFSSLHACRSYFAASLLPVVTELLDESKQDAVQIMGCDTLTTFVYCQVIYGLRLRINPKDER